MLTNCSAWCSDTTPNYVFPLLSTYSLFSLAMLSPSLKTKLFNEEVSLSPSKVRHKKRPSQQTNFSRVKRGHVPGQQPNRVPSQHIEQVLSQRSHQVLHQQLEQVPERRESSDRSPHARHQAMQQQRQQHRGLTSKPVVTSVVQVRNENNHSSYSRWVAWICWLSRYSKPKL